jgi:hypothetical protein
MTAIASPRVVIGGALGLLVVGLMVVFLVWVRPIDQQAASLRAQIQQAIADQRAAKHSLDEQHTRLQSIDQEIDRLKLFDLRQEPAFDSAFANRSNVGLIALSEILQRYHITIESLVPGPIDQQKIKAGSDPQGGVLHRRYIIHAQGRYQDVQMAFTALKSLPPSLEIDHYDIQYIGSEGGHARVYFELGLGFNFLVNTSQFEHFVDLASVSVSAAATTGPSLLDRAASGAKVLSNPSSLIASETAGVTVAPATPSVSTPSAGVQRQSSVWRAIATWLVPPAAAQTVSHPPAKPAQGTSPLKAYSFSVDRGVTLGRSEPFLPMGEPIERKVVIRRPPLQLVHRIMRTLPTTPMPETTLIAVLLSGDGPASALIQYGGERMRVRPGSVIDGSTQVAAIGRDFVLIRFGGTLHRVGLRADTPASLFAPHPTETRDVVLKTSPLPPVPPLPKPQIPAGAR